MLSPQSRTKHAKRLNCPRCGHAMELSDSPVMLAGQAAQAEPPIWLCRHCWVVLPVEPDRLRVVPSAS